MGFGGSKLSYAPTLTTTLWGLQVEVTYPSDENAIEATQQLSGNLFSALLVPICEWAVRFPVGDRASPSHPVGNRFRLADAYKRRGLSG